MQKKFRKILHPVINKGEVFHCEYQMKRKDGGTFISDHTVTGAFDDIGKRMAGIHVIRDITESKQMEEVLRESEERYRQLYSQSDKQAQFLNTLYAIAQTVNQTLYLDQVLNDALEKTIEVLKVDAGMIRLLDEETHELVLTTHKGYTAPEIKYSVIRRKTGEGSAWRCLELKKPVIKTKATEKPSSFRKKAGFLFSANVPLISKDRIMGVLGVHRRSSDELGSDDLELFSILGNQIGAAIENAKLFAQVKQQTEALSVLNIISQTVNQTLDLDIILNSALEKVIELLNANSGFLRLLSEDNQELVLKIHKGFTAEQLSKSVKSRKYGDGGNWKALLSGQVVHTKFNPNDSFQQKTNSFGLRIGAHSAVLFPLRSKDNMLGTMSIYSFIPRIFTKQEIELCTNIGRQIGIAIENARLYKDKEITIEDLKNMQAQLVQAQKMEAIGALAGGIAHDFNNILTSIIGYNELALMKLETDSEIKDDLKQVLTSCVRATDLVRQVLAISRQSAQELKPIMPRVIVKEVIKLMRSATPTTIDLKQNIKSDSIVMGDQTQIHQVLMNLCTNALHAMEETGGTLTVDLTDVQLDESFTSQYADLTPGKYLKLAVSDTGTGIKPDIITSLFEPYFTTKEIGEGTGLGLSVAQGIIKEFNGELTVTSELGKGSIFTVYLPILEKQIDLKSESVEIIPVGKERVLLVDDEATIANMCQKMIAGLGYNVTTRTSSIEALELFRNGPDDFDLVLTDMTMPNMTGERLAIELKKIRSDIPLILCTGYSKKMSEENAAKIGIDTFIMKPFVRNELAKTIRKVLDNQES
jgi:signal transduction histidine kinase/ActR/RegA family two-component response regulator/PAS domain-containing protein